MIASSGDPGIRLESASQANDVITLRNSSGRVDLAGGAILVPSTSRVEFSKYSMKFDGTAQGKHEIRTGGRTGTGTYTLFTNGISTTQSAGIVEVWGIYGTPSNANYRLYVIGGNRTIATAVGPTHTSSIPQPTLAWSGAALQISNSNSSLYYHVRVTLHDIGNGWTATWGNFPGIG